MTTWDEIYSRLVDAAKLCGEVMAEHPEAPQLIALEGAIEAAMAVWMTADEQAKRREDER